MWFPYSYEQFKTILEGVEVDLTYVLYMLNNIYIMLFYIFIVLCIYFSLSFIIKFFRSFL